MSIVINGNVLHPHCKVIGASFRGSTFNRVIMHHADFKRSEFDGAVIKDCNLSHSNLAGASLVGCDLANSNFQFANLTGTNLSGSLFEGADFRNTDLSKATLNFGYFNNVIIDKSTKLPDFQLPSGDLIGYKALKGGLLATLKIPANARRTAVLGSRKCRAEFVEVLSIIDGDYREVLNGGVSPYYPTPYHIGETVHANRYDADIRKECAPGIGFYMSAIVAMSKFPELA